MAKPNYARPRIFDDHAPLWNDADPAGARQAAHELWHAKGIAVIRPTDCQGLDRQFVEAVANRIYGRRQA